MDIALSDASTILEDRMRAALQSSGPSPSHGTAPRGRHRFVQDGEVPVTVLARQRGPEESRAAVTELERALGIERDARAAAEKALQHAEETIRQLQTRLAHAEIARAETAALPAPMPVPSQANAPSEGEDEAAPAPRRARRRPAETAAAEPQDIDPAPVTEDADAADATDEAIEWWRPGWRERLRKAR